MTRPFRQNREASEPNTDTWVGVVGMICRCPTASHTLIMWYIIWEKVKIDQQWAQQYSIYIYIYVFMSCMIEKIHHPRHRISGEIMVADKLISTMCGETEKQQQKIVWSHLVTFVHLPLGKGWAKNARVFDRVQQNCKETATVSPSTNICQLKRLCHTYKLCWCTDRRWHRAKRQAQTIAQRKHIVLYNLVRVVRARCHQLFSSNNIIRVEMVYYQKHII